MKKIQLDFVTLNIQLLERELYISKEKLNSLALKASLEYELSTTNDAIIAVYRRFNGKTMKTDKSTNTSRLVPVDSTKVGVLMNKVEYRIITEGDINPISIQTDEQINIMNNEDVLKQYVNQIKEEYDKVKVKNRTLSQANISLNDRLKKMIELSNNPRMDFLLLENNGLHSRLAEAEEDVKFKKASINELQNKLNEKKAQLRVQSSELRKFRKYFKDGVRQIQHCHNQS